MEIKGYDFLLRVHRRERYCLLANHAGMWAPNNLVRELAGIALGRLRHVSGLA